MLSSVCEHSYTRYNVTLTVTLQCRWEWYICLLTNKETEAQNGKGCTSDKSWDFNTSFLGLALGLLPPLHTSDVRKYGSVEGLPTPGSWKAISSSLTATCARPSSCILFYKRWFPSRLRSSRAYSEFSLLVESFLWVIPWFSNFSVAGLLKVLIWRALKRPINHSSYPLYVQNLLRNRHEIRRMEIKMSALMGVRPKWRSHRSGLTTDTLILALYTFLGGRSGCTYVWGAWGWDVPAGWAGEVAEEATQAQFLPQCLVRWVTPSLGRTERGVGWRQMLFTVLKMWMVLFYGARRWRKWLPQQ